MASGRILSRAPDDLIFDFKRVVRLERPAGRRVLIFTPRGRTLLAPMAAKVAHATSERPDLVHLSLRRA